MNFPKEQVLDSLPDGLFLVQSDGKLLYLNPAAERM
ncbi:MAG: PAS domain-containing protein, partial [Deltaproteobacteria bacterium]|nr:PAS domain-containing protein [Deltaproteobacteria bacterium]